MKKWMKTVLQYMFNLAVAYDQLMNTYLGGNPDETLSHRISRARGSRPNNIALAIAAYVINVLFLCVGETDHIKKSQNRKTGAKEVWDWNKKK